MQLILTSILKFASQSCPKYYYQIGASPKPDFLFCLDTKKEAKKVKAAPASLKKATAHD